MYRSPDGWFQYTETWSVKTLFNMYSRKQLDFDWDKQRGYSKVIKIMDTDKAWEVHDHLIDEYFSMREVIQNTYNEAQLAILKIIEAKNDLEKAEAICHYNAVVVKPLEETIEETEAYGWTC